VAGDTPVLVAGGGPAGLAAAAELASRGVPCVVIEPHAVPGARLPHAWLPGGSSLYGRLGAGFTLLGPAGEQDPGVRPDTIGGDRVSSAESGSPGAAGLSMFH
jgi:2-polyprenyl-6-methoxyphenol hydroxylase-like FAD-dependent oxidoreductase